jgi:hypothetical protein
VEDELEEKAHGQYGADGDDVASGNSADRHPRALLAGTMRVC